MIRTVEETAAAFARAFARSSSLWLAEEAARRRGCAGAAAAPAEDAATQEAAHEASAFPLERPLGRVTEAEAAAGLVELKRLSTEWRRFGEAPGWTVSWRAVRWRGLGVKTELPARIAVDSPESLCRVLHALRVPGIPSPEGWAAALERALELIDRFARLDGVAEDQRPTEGRARILNLLKALRPTGVHSSSDMADEDFRRLIDVAGWLLEHPDSGLFVRELPVEGVDTKWFETHCTALFRLWNFARGVMGEPAAASPAEFLTAAGLREKPVFVRVRHAGHWTGGDPDEVVQLTLERLAADPTDPADAPAVLIIENEQTGLSVETDPSVPILIGLGYGVAALRNVPWLAQRRILYFGDLDTHGLAILAECRRALPQTESVLMNRAVWEEWRRLAAQEPVPVAKRPVGLTAEEAALFDALKAVKGRLEQERIPLAVVNRAVAEVLSGEAHRPKAPQN